MAKHLVDTDLYIDLIQSGGTLPILRELYQREASGIYFSSVVAQELLAGVRHPAARKHVEALLGPFEKTGRVVTPGHRQWKEAGDVLARLLDHRPDLKSKLPALVNDCLLALSARAIGATLYSRNRDDFMMLRKMRTFSLVIVS
jgi:predicted nucleic acid-binding protein